MIMCDYDGCRPGIVPEDGSITAFTPDAAGTYAVQFSDAGDTWRRPLIGWATIFRRTRLMDFVDPYRGTQSVHPMIVNDEGAAELAAQYAHRSGTTPDPADWRIVSRDTPGVQVRKVPCPVCQTDAYYCPSIDRYVHADGSANDPCWLHMLRGLPTPAPAAINAAQAA